MTAAILVVEDDPAARDLLVQLLHLEGFAPITAANGRQAMDFLRAGGRVDVILLDLAMPEMSGWQFRVEQQRDARLATIPVVVTSAFDDAGDLNAAASFRKPLDLPRLLNTVRRLCGISPTA